ncbi:unnamed protein product, partial [marine sediment metagenome]
AISAIGLVIYFGLRAETSLFHDIAQILGVIGVGGGVNLAIVFPFGIMKNPPWRRTPYFLNNVERYRAMLYEGNANERRRAAVWLSRMQEDGLAILERALLNTETNGRARKVAAYGLRRLCNHGEYHGEWIRSRGRMKDMAFKVLEMGLTSKNSDVVKAALHGLFWIRGNLGEEKAGEAIIWFLDKIGEDPSKEYRESIFKDVARHFHLMASKDKVQAKDKFDRISNLLTNEETACSLHSLCPPAIHSGGDS